MRVFSIALVTCLMVFVGTASAVPVDETRSAKPKGTVDIRNVAGSVDVVGWDRPEVQVTGTLGPLVRRLDFENRHGHTLVHVVPPRVRMGSSGIQSHLTIHLPRASRLDIEAVSANVTVSGVYGAMELEAVSGTIKVSPAMTEPPKSPETGSQESNEPDKEPLIPPVPSEIDAHTVSGSIVIAIDAGEIRAETVSGRVSVKGNADEIEVKTVSGRVAVEGVPRKIRVETISGDVEAVGWWKDYRSESISGDVKLTMLPENASVPPGDGTTRVESHSGNIQFRGCVMSDGRVDLSAHSGDIEATFEGDCNAVLDIETFSGDITLRGRLFAGQGTTIHSVSRTLKCTIGSGDGEVRVQTFSGDIVLDRR